MKPAVQRLVEQLNAADWFASVGRPLPAPHAERVTAAQSWREAVNGLISCQWGELIHAQRDCLTVHLSRGPLGDRTTWSERSREAKSAINPLVERRMKALAEVVTSPDELMLARENLRFSLVAACLELEYAEARPPVFFGGLVPWHLAGRLPCGWGERRADGSLQLFEPTPESAFDEIEPDPLKPFYQDAPRLIDPKLRLPTFGRLIVY